MTSSPPPAEKRRSLAAALACVAAGTLFLALAGQTVLEQPDVAGHFFSTGVWARLVSVAGGTVHPGADAAAANLSLVQLGGRCGVLSLAAWLAGGAWLAFRTGAGLPASLAAWGRGWLWWFLPGVWEALRVLAFALGLPQLEALLLSTPEFWFAVTLAGWSATLLTLAAGPPSPAFTAASNRRGLAVVLLAAAVYAALFTAMNWQLYRGLLLPHGDSAMYEEHLWNLLHGKGFRSYLDQGLFLGEHLQVIHLLLLPVYVVWPSQLLLELCESLALASGAVAVYWLAHRHSGSVRAAAWLAAAYLLYVPLHFLDIAVDLKTFRPNALGVPALLFALDQLERRRLLPATILLLAALSAQEDYAATLAPLGVWLALAGAQQRDRRYGLVLAGCAAAYLLAAVTLVIPAFRHGADVHYARYFGELGSSPRDILASLWQQPGVVLGKIFSVRSAVYAAALLVPLGLLPLLSPGRLLVAGPWFGVLCLLELSAAPADRGQMLVPLHHFHAPSVPILLWSAAAGLRRAAGILPWLARRFAWFPIRLPHPAVRDAAARFAGLCALATGLLMGFSPLSIGFWDPDSPAHWRARYVPGPRAEMFTRIAETIPRTARVASTDFVHPRFTHHERSYDYSDYPRAVNNNRPGAPPDTEYIVIDTQHPYSRIHRPEDIREYREHPEEWEVLPDVTDGYFIILRRRMPTGR